MICYQMAQLDTRYCSNRMLLYFIKLSNNDINTEYIYE